MKRILALVVAAVMLITAIPVTASAADRITPVANRLHYDAPDGNQYWYNVYADPETTEIYAAIEYVAYGEHTITELIFPAYVPYTVDDTPIDIPVRWISNHSDSTLYYGALIGMSRSNELSEEYDMQKTLRRVVIPDTVEYIGRNSFVHCEALMNVVLGSGVKVIEECAFEYCPFTSITFPASLEYIGRYAFGNCPALENVTFSECGPLTIDEDAFIYLKASELNLPEGLVSIATMAFAASEIESVTFPSTLQTIANDAFYMCMSLTSVNFPAQMNEDFTHLAGFSNCTALSSITIPSTVTHIDGNTFFSSGLESIIIPSSVTYIGNGAFYSCHDLTSVTIAGGSVPLTIGPSAFSDCIGLAGKTIELPERVSTINEAAFRYVYDSYSEPSGATIRILNPSIEIAASPEDQGYYNLNTDSGQIIDPWYDDRGTVVYYPASLTAQTSPSFIEYMDAVEASGRGYPAFEVINDEPQPQTPVYHTVSGTVPEGARVAIAAGTRVINAELTRNSFSEDIEEGVDIKVIVSLDAYADKVYSLDAAQFISDWNIGTVTSDDMTPIENTGVLELTLSGAGANDSCISIFDSSDVLVESGRATGTKYISASLPLGYYYVVAFAKNDYISSISSVEELTGLGISTFGNSGQVALRPGGNTQCALSVPAMDTQAFASILESYDIINVHRLIPRGSEFYVQVKYEMKSGHDAESVKLNIPAGIDLVAVSSDTTSYGTSRSFTPSASDKAGATLYICLRASEARNYSFGATVTSGNVSVPLGTVSLRIDEIVLETDGLLMSEGTVQFTVYTAPNTTVDVNFSGEAPIQVTTNAHGKYKGEITVPAGLYNGSRTTLYAATQNGSDYVNLTRYTDVLSSIHESCFIHANRKTNAVVNGKDVSGGYYVYVANGKEENKNWTFSVTFDSATPITDTVTLNVYMADGSVRHAPMAMTSMETVGGFYRQTYAATIYIEQAGDHVFRSDLLPVGYDVTFSYQGRDFTLDGDAVQQIQDLSGAEGTQRQNEVDRAIDDWDAQPGDSDVLFNDGYKISDDPGFGDLPAEDQQLVLDTERAVEEALDSIPEAFGSDKKWSDYDGPEDFLEDIGVSYEENVPYDPQALANDGYTVSEADGNGKSYAFRENVGDDGSVRLDYINSDGVKVTTEPIVDAYVNGLQAGLGYGIGQLSDAAVKWAGHFDATTVARFNQFMGEEAVPTLSRGVRCAGAAVQGLYGCFQASNNSNDYINAVEEYEKAKGDLENVKIWENYYETHGYGSACISAIRNECLAAELLLNILEEQKRFALCDTLIGAGFTVASVVGTLYSGGTATAAIGAINTLYDIAANSNNVKRAYEICDRLMDLAKAKEKRDIECDRQKNAKWIFNPHLDPSGIVYEAVESNTLEGVTAKIYDVDHAAYWDANNYDQETPQITLEDGFYAWDVPSGHWRVDFEKDGYYAASTEVVEVPPPQTGLKTAMISNEAPVVVSAKAYPDFVEIVFSQYMDVTEEVASAGFESVAEWVDPEPVSEGSNTFYSKVVRLKFTGTREIGEQIALNLYNGYNYAGYPLDSFAATVTVEALPDSIVLNYEDSIAILIGETPVPRVTAQVLDAEGAPLSGLTVTATGYSDLFAEVTAVNAVTNDDGIATFEIEGLLPGTTSLTLTVDGTSLSTTIPVEISVDTNQVARPTATLGNESFGANAPKDNYVTVAPGTTLTLSCETAGASIYYSLNDTCPCQDLANRVLYTGPITINEDTYIRIAAYKAGMEYSERLNLHITVDANAAPSNNTPAVVDPGDSSGEDGQGSAATLRFNDVKMGSYCYKAVEWAVSHDPQITQGFEDGTFRPDDGCSRGQAVTFLWRAFGCPEPETAENPFTDVSPASPYYKAILWAVEKGITNGTTPTTFDPNGDCLRSHVVTFLWRAEGRPAPLSAENSFTDVAPRTFCYEAVLWAVEKGITQGFTPTEFRPDQPCLRGQAVTFLYRAFGE